MSGRAHRRRSSGPGAAQTQWVLRDVAVSLDELTPDSEWPLLRRRAASAFGVPAEALQTVSVLRESLDARRRDRMAVLYTLLVTMTGLPGRKPANAMPHEPENAAFVLRAPSTALATSRDAAASAGMPMPVVVGAGPSGLFCALALARAGRPAVVIERGKPVAQRQADVRAFWQEGRLDPESNVQFGEGGAGTFSDGKLTTRIHDPRCRTVLETFVACGAPEEILWRAKPHVGTDVLAPLLVRLREELQRLGTVFRFGTRVSDLLSGQGPAGQGRVRGVRLSDGTSIETDVVVLAIGHSARDTFTMLRERGVAMTPKPFSVGVRIEHPQALINQARYGGREHYKLGAAEYQLFERFADRTAYTFCMCPGGSVVAAASEPGTIVTNGMSESTRGGANANSAFVVSVDARDMGGDPLDGVGFQRRLEQNAFALGGGTGAAPVQRLEDFLLGRASIRYGVVRPTYTGPTELARLDEGLPAPLAARLREAVPAFERRLAGFSLPDALLTGYETRTSSPVRLERGPDFQAVNLPGLYPAGEGAGYAGGIMSAAVDGLRVAEAVLGMVPEPDAVPVAMPGRVPERSDDAAAGLPPALEGERQPDARKGTR